jgi:hypothetical protein
MSEPAFVTRDQAAATGGLDPGQVERMAEAGYEASKTTGSSLPPWRLVQPTYQDAIRREVIAAIKTGIAAGYLALAKP